jgi:hypothetical protein
MNPAWLPPSDALAVFAAVWLMLLGFGGRFMPLPASVALRLAVAAAAAGVMLVPIKSLQLWNWVFSYYPNPSLPILGLLIAQRSPRFLGVTIFQSADWWATWIFGAVVGSLVYLQPLIFGRGIDFHYWGWHSNYAAAVLTLTAIMFLARGNRFGVLLVAALVAFALSALESTNCWDYVVDPIYWLASVVVIVRRGAIAGWTRRQAKLSQTAA